MRRAVVELLDALRELLLLVERVDLLRVLGAEVAHALERPVELGAELGVALRLHRRERDRLADRARLLLRRTVALFRRRRLLAAVLLQLELRPEAGAEPFFGRVRHLRTRRAFRGSGAPAP